MTTSNDDAVREVEREQRAARRHTTSTPRADEPTTADLTRELHLMETQVREYGYPGTRAVLNLIGDLRKENHRLRTALTIAADDITHVQEAGFDSSRRAAAEDGHRRIRTALDQRNP